MPHPPTARTRGFHRKAKRLFAAVLRLPCAEREERLRRACRADARLFEEVTSLLRNHHDGPVLSEPTERRIGRLAAAGRAAALSLLGQASGDPSHES